MSAVHLSTPIEKLTRVGAVTASRLLRLGITSVNHLLEHYPVRYEDYTRTLSTNALAPGAKGSMTGTLRCIETKKTRYKKMSLTRAELDDGKGAISLVWFNQAYISDALSPNDVLSIAGNVSYEFGEWVIKNPSYEKIHSGHAPVHTARLLPVYPATLGITQKQIRFLISQALPAADEYVELLPPHVIKDEQLVSKREAITYIHCPSNAREYGRALERLKFEELFLIQLMVEKTRRALQSENAPCISCNIEETKKAVRRLPFTLTDDQKKAAWRILKDMESRRAMNRLLQGEVGSGKTVVAGIAALNAARSGFQTAFMAPTEILAHQHYRTLAELFPNCGLCLLTRALHLSTRDARASRSAIKEAIRKGDIDIIVGTHAMIQRDVTFSRLGIAIIDEQHRFGVAQRKALKNKSPQSHIPHLLSMTATPIPRTLALTLYGDLSISSIRQLPKTRKKISTSIVDKTKRARVYEFIRSQIKEGRQAFVVCPLIEESDSLGVRAVTKEYETLRASIFPDRDIGIVHGRMSTDEKKDIMRRFEENDISVLVSTSVIEVGVDVPNASIMMIEGSERFGLSQLHQIRGRVGRGEHQSYCFLFSDHMNTEVTARLQSLCRAKDGFEIAELDLKLRGPGAIYGTTQAGYFSALRIASLNDNALIAKAKECAHALIEHDTELSQYPLLAHEVEKQSTQLHFE